MLLPRRRDALVCGINIDDPVISHATLSICLFVYGMLGRGTQGEKKKHNGNSKLGQ
jgi:hypothetical protein